MTPMRSWCFEFQYPGLAPCLMGTVWTRHGAPHHEIEAACVAVWRAVMPFDPPPITKIVPGMIVFQEREE